jgi:hypothetical protein
MKRLERPSKASLKLRARSCWGAAHDNFFVRALATLSAHDSVCFQGRIESMQRNTQALGLFCGVVLFGLIGCNKASPAPTDEPAKPATEAKTDTDTKADAKTPTEIAVAGGHICLDTKQFALCATSKCTLSPDNPKEMGCPCVVASGPNWGVKTTCADRAKSLTSTFSPIEVAQKKALLVCKDKRTWADCMDAPCKLDARDPTRATCICPIKNSAPWATLGGVCNQEACVDGWSAFQYSVKQQDAIRAAFTKLKVPGGSLPLCGEKATE